MAKEKINKAESGKDKELDKVESQGTNEQQADEEIDIEPEMLENLPPEMRSLVKFTMLHGSGGYSNPITKKINAGHIDKMLDLSAKDDEREYNERKSGRRYTLIYVIIFLISFALLTIYLVTDHPQIYNKILSYLVSGHINITF